MDVVPHAARGRWIHDSRGPERALRVSAHPAAGFLVLSTWRDGECVGTVRVSAEEAAELMAGLAQGLAELARRPASEDRPDDPAPVTELRPR
jgi:hypothetical protein